MLDSTLTTPYLIRPFEHGADIVFHSATKFLQGHGVVIGGLLVDSGRFDWLTDSSREKFATLSAPYHGFHNMVFAEESSTAAFLLRCRREGLRDFGACMAAATAWQILQGIETLPVRMERHIANTRKVLEFLRSHAFVGAIHHPELPEHRDYELAKKYFPKGASAVFSFDLKGTRAQGRAFIDNLRLFSHLANVGDARSLVIHPASTTHSRMSTEALVAASITEGTIRLSIGLEDAKDLIEDLTRALKAAERAK